MPECVYIIVTQFCLRIILYNYNYFELLEIQIVSITIYICTYNALRWSFLSEIQSKKNMRMHKCICSMFFRSLIHPNTE